jgi:large subunit ribosomal protein L17
MSSHRRLTKHFGRKTTALKALMRGLMISLVEHGRIKTTVVKAKEVRRHIEKAITLGRKGNLNSIRVISSKLANSDSALEIVKNIAPRFKDRPGGYTRVVKIGRRPGDKAEMAFLEFVDFDWKAKMESKLDAKDTKKSAAAKKDDKSVIKIASKIKKVKSIAEAKTKKGIRQMKNKSRAAMFLTR